MIGLKQQLYDLCMAYIASREAMIKNVIADAREAAGNETKSSAGDKYETGREMMQQEIDMNQARLSELNVMKVALERIIPTREFTTAQPGALVYTGSGIYYIAIPAGQLKTGDAVYYAISPASPVGIKLAGLKTTDTFILNGKQITIEKII